MYRLTVHTWQVAGIALGIEGEYVQVQIDADTRIMQRTDDGEPVVQNTLPQTISGIARLAYVKAQLAKERERLEKRKRIFKRISNFFFYAAILVVLCAAATMILESTAGANVFGVQMLDDAITYMQANIFNIVVASAVLLMISLIFRMFCREVNSEKRKRKKEGKRQKVSRQKVMHE